MTRPVHRALEMNDRKRAVALVRVSTDRQELGPEAQRHAITEWAAREGVTVVQWFNEVESGGNDLLTGRRVLLDAIASLKAQDCGLLVVAKRDRLGRSVKDNALATALTRDEGARIVCADGTLVADGGPESNFFNHIYDAVAEFERGRIVLRILEAMAVKRARGERLGAIPYGWDVSPDPNSKVMVKNNAEQEVIKFVRLMYSRGKMIPEINGALRKKGVKSRNGVWFKTVQLQRMLTKEQLAQEARLTRGK